MVPAERLERGVRLDAAIEFQDGCLEPLRRRALAPLAPSEGRKAAEDLILWKGLG